MRDPGSVKNAVAELIQVAGHPNVSVTVKRVSIFTAEKGLEKVNEI